MQHRQTSLSKSVNILIDYVLLNLSLVSVYSYLHKTFSYWAHDKTYINVILIFNLVWLLSANIINLYQTTNLYQMYKKSLKTYVLYVVLIAYLTIYLNIESYYVDSRYLFISMGIFGALLGIWKISFVKGIKYLSIFRQPLRRAVIVGGDRAGTELYNRFKTDLNIGYEVLGIFNDQPLRDSFQEIHLGDTSVCMNFSVQNDVAEIFCALPLSEKDTIERLIKESDKNMIRFN